MLTVAQILLEYVCPLCGIITGNLMFFAPYADARRAARSRYSLGADDLNPTPWAFMLGNCFGWVVYGILLHNYFVFFANIFGFVLSIWLNMVAIKLQFCEHRSREMIQSLSLWQHRQQQQQADEVKGLLLPDEYNQVVDCNGTKQTAANRRSTTTTAASYVSEELNARNDNNNNTASIININNGNNNDNSSSSSTPNPNLDSAARAAIVKAYEPAAWKAVLESTTPAPAPHERLVMSMVLFWTCIVATIALFGAQPPLLITSQVRQLIVGIAVNLNLVFFYAAPLSTIWQVVSTQSCRSIHVPTMITNTLNGAFWCAYGVAVKDLFIAVPNALGAILGVLQIVLCIIFPRQPADTAALTTAGAATTAAANAAAGDHKDGNESAPSTDEETGVASAPPAAATTTAASARM
jgi:solute carrier family 50 (sugar transporter)